MNNEIKEILDNFKIYEDRYKKCNETQFIIFYRDIHLLLDYITNLQEKVNQYENPDDLTLFYMWLDVKAKDKMKELEDNLYSANQVVNELLDVKEENERLKELCDKYEEEHSTAFKIWTMKMKEMPDYEEKMNYKSRCKKAIEYIENNKKETCSYFNGKEYEYRNFTLCCEPNDLLNILKGSEVNE